MFNKVKLPFSLETLGAVIGVALVLGLVAFYAQRDYQRLEGDRVATLSELEEAREQNYSLMKIIGEREATIQNFQEQIGDIASTVGTLEKLSKTDEELLKKYSKVYFLNENYSPATLTDIDEKYVLEGATSIMINAKVWPYLRKLFEEAEKADLGLLSASAFRSFATQSALKSGYTSVYGSGANKFSADQGYSEHQLGTTLDFTTAKLGNNFASFASEPAYGWLLDNAHKYGFVLSYPENNHYYKFEPWHWRFVGVELATMLHEEGKHFYDLDQREIDKYLVKLFD